MFYHITCPRQETDKRQQFVRDDDLAPSCGHPVPFVGTERGMILQSELDLNIIKVYKNIFNFLILYLCFMTRMFFFFFE